MKELEFKITDSGGDEIIVEFNCGMKRLATVDEYMMLTVSEKVTNEEGSVALNDNQVDQLIKKLQELKAIKAKAIEDNMITGWEKCGLDKDEILNVILDNNICPNEHRLDVAHGNCGNNNNDCVRCWRKALNKKYKRD